MTVTVRKTLWLLLGLLSTLLGFIGIVLPLLPTTPFLLLAAFAFAQSSERLHQWLVEHPTFGPIITNWNIHGAIDRRSKKIAIIMILATPLITWLIGVPPWALLAQIMVLSLVALFILSRPD